MQDAAYCEGHGDGVTDPLYDLESRKRCCDCGGRVEWYWMHNDLWALLVAPEDSEAWICVRCIGRRLGRPLGTDDLTETPVNRKPALLERLSIPYGHCYCSCGEKTQIATMTQRACGWIKGEPKRYVFNHHLRRRVSEQYSIEDLGHLTPCWVWQGTTRDGYGRIFREGRLWNASRWYYTQAIGPIPEGMQLDHLCHDPRVCVGGSDCPHRGCVNPDHLQPKTQTENVRAGRAPLLTGSLSFNGAKTHCKHGHEFTPENTYVHPGTGKRTCRTCQRLWHQRNRPWLRRK